MGFIVFLILWYFIFARNNPKQFQKIKQNKSKIIFAIILLTLFSGSDVFLTLSVIALVFGIPLFAIYKAIKSTSTEEGREEREYQKTRNQTVPKSEQLPKAVPKRIRIVEKFNKKYGLNLTDSQIRNIVDSSYVSTEWEYFISSMNVEYDTIHQWFRAPIGAWLRVYLKVFNVQNISADMSQQKQICIGSFDEIFRTADLSTYNTPAWDINKINNKYMTNFDDITFMIAYRFLEANGKKYDLGKVQILKADEELSDLKKKYDEDQSAYKVTGAF